MCFVSVGWWLESHVFGGGWKALGFVTVCWVVAGKPGVLRLSVGWWLESRVFLVVAGKPCVLLLSVGWWLESQVFCFCLLAWLDSHAWLEMYNHCPCSHVKFKTG